MATSRAAAVATAEPVSEAEGLRCKEAALGYAAQGWAVFPVPPGTKRSYKSAEHSDGRAWGMTRNAEEIRRDFTRWPDAGIGIPTGAVNGIIVVETDTVEGHGIDGSNSLAQLETKHGALPETLQAISPSGSIHRYFKHPGAGTKIKSSASELGAGIDVRGDGGMVIAPPTVRPSVGVYRWLNSNPIAAMPAWLIELTKDKQPPPTKRLSIRERAQAAVRRWEAKRRGDMSPPAYADAGSNMKSVILPPPHRAAETTPSIALRSVCCSWCMRASSIAPMSNGN